jgi:hypothetical protein
LLLTRRRIPHYFFTDSYHNFILFSGVLFSHTCRLVSIICALVMHTKLCKDLVSIGFQNVIFVIFVTWPIYSTTPTHTVLHNRLLRFEIRILLLSSLACVARASRRSTSSPSLLNPAGISSPSHIASRNSLTLRRMRFRVR